MTIGTLVQRWVGELWNPWAEAVLPEIAHPDVSLRGLLGPERAGYAGVSAAMGQVHAALPDFHTEVSSLLCEGEQALAHLRCTGTHRGLLLGVEPTGRALRWECLGRFEARGGKLSQVWVLCDLLGLRAQLGAPAALPSAAPPAPQRVVPTLRASDWERSRAFWVGGLGFQVDFEWRHAPGIPVYAGISRGDLALHISEHAGDCQPGGRVSLWVDDVDALHAELAARGGLAELPEPRTQPWGRRELSLYDPDDNRVVFHTPSA